MNRYKQTVTHTKQSMWFLFTILFILIPSVTYAAFTCNDDTYNPVVYKLTKLDDGVEIRLSGIYSKSEADNPAVRLSKMLNKPMPRISPALQWKINKGWKYIEHKPCNYCSSDHSPECPIKLPNWVNQPQEEIDNYPMTHIIEEKASMCVVKENIVLFGINFYKGEGYTGNGGFGRYDISNNHMDVRHLPELADIPIYKVVWDGTNLWGATTQNYECSGNPPSIGVVKYDWFKKKLKKIINDENSPCGFVVNDLLIAHGYLWVATDVGVSQLHLKNDTWTHFLPEREIPFNVTEGSCLANYKKVLSYQPKDIIFPDDRLSYYEKFYKNIKEFKPGLIKLLDQISGKE